MRASRRSRAWATGGVVVLAVLVGSFPGARPVAAAGKTPHAIAPTIAAWYDEARATAITPGVPEPGVTAKDLVVGGVTVDAGDLPLPLPSSAPKIKQINALAALSFRLPKGATAATLTLVLTDLTTAKLDSRLPSGVSPVACPTSTAFKAGGQQPGPTAPKYDCTKRSAIGQLSTDGKAVVFPGIGRLATGRKLSVVIVPGSLGIERLVFSKPGPKTLSLLSFGQTAPPIPTPTPVSTPTSAVSAGGGSGGSAPSSGSGPAVNLPPAGNVSTPPLPASSPQVAGTEPTPDAQAGLRQTAAKPIDDTHARMTALALLVGLVVATAWLTFTDSGGQAIATLRVVRAARAGTQLPVVPPKLWGVGRFRSVRTGPPPTI